jgi:glycosyltransferase involved in cell wall biosynthesis
MSKASLIISVYNKIRNLELILAALSIQTFKDFEIIISDDGSGSEMKDFINERIKRADLNIKHVWQDDDGFRKNKILNQCIRKSESDYLIFYRRRLHSAQRIRRSALYSQKREYSSFRQKSLSGKRNI